MADLQERTARRDHAEEHRALIAWLDPHSVNMEENLKEGLKNHHPGTGEWLFESDCYKAWATGPSSILWIHGIRKIDIWPFHESTVLTRRESWEWKNCACVREPPLCVLNCD